MGSGSTLTLANVNSNVGQFGSSTAIPVITVNAKGLTTAISTVAVSIPSGSLSFIGDVTGTGSTGSDTTLTLATVNSNVGAYAFGQQLRSTIEFVISIKDELLILGGIIATVFVANKIIAFVAAIQTLITAMVALRAAATAASVATAFATGGGSIAGGAIALAAAGIATGVVSSAVSGGNAANAASTATAGQLATGAARAGTTVNNITVQSVDAEGSARAVAKVLNDMINLFCFLVCFCCFFFSIKITKMNSISICSNCTHPLFCRSEPAITFYILVP